MKLSMMTYTMARQGYGVEDFINTAVEQKMDGIDWVTTYGCNPNELKKKCNDVGLPIVCHTFFLSKLLKDEKNWLDEAKHSIENAVVLGAPVVMIPTCNRNDMERDDFRRFWISALKQVAPLTDDAKLILTIENFPGNKSAFIIADDYFEAKAEIPQLKLTYDNGNAAGGENPVESFKKCAADVVHVHFKDWNIKNEPTKGFQQMLDGRYFKSALIGEGDIDTPACFNALRDYGYDGYINLEYEGNKYDGPESVRRMVKYLRSL